MPRRPQMLSSAVRRLIAPVLRECPRECGIVSITEVEVSPDLSVVTVYVSALQEIDAAMNFLEDRTQELRKKLTELEGRRVPILRFRRDVRSERGSRIDKLLSGGETPDDK